MPSPVSPRGSPPSTSSITADDNKSENIREEVIPVDPFIVDAFEPGDPDDPQNWSKTKRWYLTLASALLVLNATFSSSSPSGIYSNLIQEFHMSEIVGILTISLFVCGYCVGPILWGPLSEQFGRRPIFIWPFVFYTAFTAGGALAKNTTSVLVFRFLSGTFAAAPLTNSGALISDIWDANMRGTALAIFTVAPFAGPALGPTVAGFIGDSTSWRWLFWVLTAFAGACTILIVTTIPETYAPVLLKKKAQTKRLETGDERYYSPLEREKISFSKQLERVVARPFVILFNEAMLMALTVYMSFVYGCLYLLFTAYPIVFTRGHGFTAGISGLMFLPIPIGGSLAVCLYVFYYNPLYEKAAQAYQPRPVPPEFRLDVAMHASPLFAVAFFWFGWTSFPQISYWAPLLSGLLMGFSIQLIFLGLFNYIVDAYLFVAASAMASCTVARSLCGAAFPLFATDLYKALNPRFASTLLGCLAVAMIPIPLVLKRYGPTLRKKSRFCPYFDELVVPSTQKEQPPEVSMHP